MALDLGIKNIFSHGSEFDQGMQQKPLNVGTREIWFQMQTAGATSSSALSFIVYEATSGGGSVQTSIKIPEDFGELESLQIIVIPQATIVNCDIDWDIHIASVGELSSTGAINVNDRTYNLTLNTLAALDITDIVQGKIKAGDYIGIDMTNNDAGDIIGVLGVKLKYS